MKPLEGIIVIDFSQFLSGPSAGLRLADLGAQVIKIEKPVTGDICRQLYVSDTRIDGESTIFHAINRNKQSYAADLKNPADIIKLKQIISRADVMLHNFRPGVMQRLGFDYEAIQAIHPGIIYAEISGYGNEGPWKDLPGQDLLLQAISGLTWLSNSDKQQPTPMGVAVVDLLAGTHITQGILAALYRKAINGEGALVQVSMLESILDFQFEVLTCFLNDEGRLPVRRLMNNGPGYIPAPYGIYQTADGYIALAMDNIPALATLLRSNTLQEFAASTAWATYKDEIKQTVAKHIVTRPTASWIAVFDSAGIQCAPVMDYQSLMQEVGYQTLHMELQVKTSNGLSIKTTRCPFRMDGEFFTSETGAPLLGEHNRQLEKQFGLS
jgi:crotonobetainyl-CoA:carnitine CoA-transferase CaiB-like acyl-CoA transferase